MLSISVNTVLRAPYSLAEPPEIFMRILFKSSVSFHVVAYWTFLFLIQSLHYKRESSGRQRKALVLDRSLSDARMKILTMQLRPHFLFNTLHVISGLMRTNPDKAIRILSRLQELLRSSLDVHAPQMVPLRKELQNLDDYLAIQQVRFQDRLLVTLDVDTEILDSKVPNWILQPLVENAIQHGIGARRTGGEIRIAAYRNNGALQITVKDDGPGSRHISANAGLGLKITRARLQHLYGSSNRFVAGNLPHGGFLASLEIPVEEKR